MASVIKFPVQQTDINQASGNPSDVIRKPECRKMLGNLSGSTIDRLVRTGRLAKPMRIGARAVGWFRSDIQKYLDERNAERAAV